MAFSYRDPHLEANLRALRYYQQNPGGQPSLNPNSSSGGDIGSALTVVGASMAAHPIGWAIGAVVLVGAAAYFAFKED